MGGSSSTVTPTFTDSLNILLLGETGVGKSTFINAFVNYLAFNTLQQAEFQKPVILIPVSFILTIGDHFTEHIIKFGDTNGLNNEDFNHPGQSVTQHCKSYIFNLNDGNKLRIIDAPGFGDTRGVDQDDVNMQHILEYINNLTHLNAVCFLLKPNASRLNIFFRSCFTQLFDLLGKNARKNVIFCFTNARSTFFTPGNTAPLLKTMLTSLSMDDIPFKKENTFCFDSESFRYLVARQNGIKFNDEYKSEYETSWSTSVKESYRLLDYIHKNVTIYRMQDEWQSLKHAQLEIVRMIRPILEAMRNSLRNMILCKMNIPKESIQLHPNVITQPVALCLICKRHPTKVGSFWIVRDIPHRIHKECLDCSCLLNEHIKIDYLLDYDSPSNILQNETNNWVEQLCYRSAGFAYFLMYIARSTKDDPFWIGLVQMIVEETELCESQKPNDLNLQLVKELRKTQSQYEERMNGLKENPEHIKLSVIYDWIKYIRNCPVVKEQMDVIKQGQKIMMKQSEYEVSKDITSRLINSSASHRRTSTACILF